MVCGLLVGSFFVAACAGAGELESRRDAFNAQHAALETVPLIITEVAQSAAFAGATADKVEVFCAQATGCAAYKVCDSSAGSTPSCSALQAPPAAQQRAVVSRGTSITPSDQVWLADAAGLELKGTRVGPFDCASGSSRARTDCPQADFAECGPPNLGVSAGPCSTVAAPEPFRYSLRFATNQHGGPESTCSRPMCQALLTAIHSAQSSISFAIYGIREQPELVGALLAAQARGVAVRGVVDSENDSCTAFGYPDTPALRAALGVENVRCDTGSGYSYIMHNKFFVLDGAQVWTGSTNISDTELGGEYHSDVAVLLSSPRLAAIYQLEFEEMWGGLCHRAKADNTEHVLDERYFSDGTLLASYFSPSDDAVSNAVLPLIDGATRTLDIAMFFFTSQSIADAVLAARARGVEVRMILDASGAANVASKHAQLCGSGALVKIENWGGKSHSKWAVADAALPSSAAVVFGSMNWTDPGNLQNDENTLYVKNPAFAAAFAAEFDRQWSDLVEVVPCRGVASDVRAP